MGRIIGIDLGTTNTVVAVAGDDGPRIIQTPTGERTIPSAVAFTDKGVLVGQAACRQMVTNPTRTVYGSKRLVGRKVNDAGVAWFARTAPFDLGPAPNGDAWLRIDGELRAPQEISAHVLATARKFAEANLGEPVTRAVVTVPAYFNESQRQATKDAATIAGLDVLRILNEPTAAALAYGAHRVESNERRLIAVFDLGGGTFDVSIMAVENGIFEVMATAGDMMLGGDDWDIAIVDSLVLGLPASISKAIEGDPVALTRLKEAAERAKRELSAAPTTVVELQYLAKDEQGEPYHLRRELHRSDIEAATEELMQRLVDPCERALKDAGLHRDDVDEVLLVGGMTRWPAVEKRVAQIFGTTPSKGAHPDEIVASGAALQAGILAGRDDDAALLDVTPQAIGVKIGPSKFSPIIPRGSLLPVRRTRVFATSRDNQGHFKIDLYQGDSSETPGNKRLGVIKLT
ncbi:MAG: Hsp70 family protein, partial [Deltaproteobacteria bacterium]|nr:Hsp70 family protein [Deltaproteobacteria bacterium]